MAENAKGAGINLSVLMKNMEGIIVSVPVYWMSGAEQRRVYVGDQRQSAEEAGHWRSTNYNSTERAKYPPERHIMMAHEMTYKIVMIVNRQLLHSELCIIFQHNQIPEQGVL